MWSRSIILVLIPLSVVLNRYVALTSSTEGVHYISSLNLKEHLSRDKSVIWYFDVFHTRYNNQIDKDSKQSLLFDIPKNHWKLVKSSMFKIPQWQSCQALFTFSKVSFNLKDTASWCFTSRGLVSFRAYQDLVTHSAMV